MLLDVEVSDGQIFAPYHVATDIPAGTDLLLIRAGHVSRRGSPAYWERGPGLSRELGSWLRERFPSIRAVGVDTISRTTRFRRHEVREAHRAFLDPQMPGEPIILIEDMALEGCSSYLISVLVAPLMLEGADGAPCTILGFEGTSEIEK